VVLTLGLGVGATTAMFSVVDAVLLRPLPLPGADRIVALVPEVGGESRGGSPGLLAAWEARSRSLGTVAAFVDGQATFAGPGGAERVGGLAVSGRFAEALGVSPALGRAIAPADDRPGARRWRCSRTASGGARSAVTPRPWGGRCSSTGCRVR
jgi:putative ABC transport system permease protein